RSLLTVHAFVGMLLLPVLALKLASTGWRMVRYYLRGQEYVRRGPPHLFLRALVGPLVVVSTIALFATGILLLAVGQTEGMLVGLREASFMVWLAATGVHVLGRLPRVADVLRRRLPGTATRIAVAGATVVAGLGLATLTLPAADHLQDEMSGHIGFDSG